MPKETVRYPDALVAGVEAVVAEADAFESKSEFYRFASDFLLSLVDEDHEPTVLGYGDIVADLEADADGRLVAGPEAGEPATGPFLDAYIQVRRHLLYDDVDAARAVVTERYDPTDREALLLDEVIGRERRVTPTTATGRDPVNPPATVTRVDGEGEDEGGAHESGGDGPNAVDDGSGSGEPLDRDGPEEARVRPTEATRETDGGTDADTDHHS